MSDPTSEPTSGPTSEPVSESVSEPVRVVAAGDHFVLPSLITAAIGREAACDVRELTLGWPLEPFGPVAEVTEASDAEEELIDVARRRPGAGHPDGAGDGTRPGGLS